MSRREVNHASSSITAHPPTHGALPVTLYRVWARTRAESSSAPRWPTKPVIISSFVKASTSIHPKGQANSQSLCLSQETVR